MHKFLFKNRLKITLLFLCLSGVRTNANAQQTEQQQKKTKTDNKFFYYINSKLFLYD
jgi:hypothetical protein